MGVKNKQIFTDLAVDSNLNCMIPYFDLCNHKPSKDFEGKEKTGFHLLFKDKEIAVALSDKFKAGEEYSYSYLEFAPNRKLLDNYGFYLPKNPQNNFITIINFWRGVFTPPKTEVCKKLNCFDSDLTDVYNHEALTQFPVTVYINNVEVPLNIINALRVYFQPMASFNSADIYKRLKKGQLISYHNELSAYSYFREAILKSLDKAEVDIVRN
jgi:hypothetical protein